MPRDLAELATVLGRQTDDYSDLYFLPVAIFWGRAPAQEHSWLKLLLSEDWGLTGRLRRSLVVLMHGRDVVVKVGEPISVRELADENMSTERLERKLGRVLRVFFQGQRAATIGPDLSHRRLLLDEVLEHPVVVAAMRREVRSRAGRKEAKVRALARRYANEIAADYSYPVVRALDRALTWLWNRLYEGIDVRHLESLAEIEAGSEIVYVPCHRSHIDYLLLGHVIYNQGFAPPHTAAGLNLNMPLIGSILRRGGAFFIRRSFHGNALYAAVFRSYFRTLLSKGFPIEYFIEGTRSRTGRLLNPKLGLLAMTVEGFLTDRSRPIVFVPVYIGYEKLIEGQTFIGELRGRSKKKQSLAGLLRSVKALRERFGSVQISFGESIRLSDVLDEAHPVWRDETLPEPFRPEWVSYAAEVLANRIMTAMNEAAVINSVNLVALVILSMPKQTMVETELRAQLELYLALAQGAPYAPRVGPCALTASEMIHRCEEMGWLTRQSHSFGDILKMDERTAALASYYRNNIVHLFALPALLAAGFNNRPELGWQQIKDLAVKLYPCLRSELYLRWDARDLDAQMKVVSETMQELGLLEAHSGLLSRPGTGTSRGAQLRLCAEILQPFFERFYLGVAVLLGQGTGNLRRPDFVDRCSEAAEQLSLIFSLNSPDLFHAGLFENFVSYLLNLGIVHESSDGVLAIETARLEELRMALGFVLPPQLRQTLVNLAGVAATPPSGSSAG